MLIFTQTFDVESELKFLLNGDPTHTLDSEISLDHISGLQVLGQEQNHQILFSWNERAQLPEATPQTGTGILPHSNEDDSEVTRIALFDTHRRKHKIIYTYDRKVKIVNATVNEEHTFLGFVTQEKVEVTGQHGSLKKQDTYKAYLAEIQPLNRTFYLNLERSNYIRLQFLYGPYRTTREAHMLVFLHKESIGLYHLPMARMGDRVIMCQEPRKEQLFHRKFIWSQWDPLGQRLYLLYLKKIGRSTDGLIISKPVFTAYQFSPQASKMANFMMEADLDLSIPQIKQGTSHYSSLAPSSIIQDSTLNLTVLTQPNGTVCICYQHPWKEKTNKSNDEDSESSISYSIIMIHHKQKLHTRCNNVSKEVAKSGKLLFSWIGDYIVVQLTGWFVHLLNVDVEYEPVHHILWHDVNAYANQVNSNAVPLFSNLLRERQTSLAPGCLMYDHASGKGFRVTINCDMVASWFSETQDLHIRLSILHFAVVHSRDIYLQKQLFDSLCVDCSGMELSTFFKEALIGSTFSFLRKGLERELMQYIPYTQSETFRGQSILERSSPVPTFQIAYSNIENPQLGDQHLCRQGDLWDRLFLRLKTDFPSKNTRFDQCSVIGQVYQEVSPEQEEVAKEKQQEIPDKPKTSFFQKISTAAKNAFTSQQLQPQPPTKSSYTPTPRSASRAELILGKLPFFLAKSSDTDVLSNAVVSKTKNIVCQFILSKTPHVLKNKLTHVAEEYVQCQLNAARLMFHLVWSILGAENSNMDVNISLKASSSEEFEDLFHAFERIVLAIKELSYPIPAAFQAYFTTLGFIVLNFRMFLQYVDDGILKLPLDFAVKLFEDLDDSAENVQVKLLVISRLSKANAQEILQSWSHPLAQRYLARSYTTHLFGPSYRPANLVSNPHGRLSLDTARHGAITFPPLSAFLSLVEYRDPEILHTSHPGDFRMNSWYLEKAAILESTSNGLNS